MRIYKTNRGIVIEKENKFYRVKENNWDHFINDDNLYQKIASLVQSSAPLGKELINEVLAPIGNQELWACGVTYLRSKVGRQEESKVAGGSDFYARVYEAERPEVRQGERGRRTESVLGVSLDFAGGP